jgi:catechol 2,3-dioxygenase-like lactoylglutathione lyase family enzyme
MSLHGVSHIGLSTLDFEATRTFYEDVLGFRLVTIEQIDFEEGGSIRHAFFDCGDGQLLGFMEPRVSKDYQPNTTPASIKASACPTGFTTSPSTLARSKSCTRSVRS